ncbi:MAG: DUF2155 domain-containing protein [bacterium]|nr:DUF2155 domain-containing protein [bacterium]
MKGLELVKKSVLLCLFVVVLSALSLACSEKKDVAQSPHGALDVPQGQPQVVAAPARVEVPNEILSAWKAIRVEVIDFMSAKAARYTVNIGGEKEIGDSGIKIKALNFLPAFQMNVPIITSRSNELENPAAQIEVYEGGEQIFKGWLFTLYPTTHAFMHPKYSITLIEGIAVN